MPAPFRQRDVERALKAAKAVGYSQTIVEIEPSGVIRILTDPAAPAANLSPLERARADRARRQGAA